MEPRPLPPKLDLATLRAKNESLHDAVISLLHLAAQAEHDLMVQYLYAAYSLGGEEANRRPDFVRECRDTLLAVAREEMGHLLTVQNILLLIGGPVSFERREWRAASAPFEVRLERFSIASLAKYLHIEAPASFNRERLKKYMKGREQDLEMGAFIGFMYGWLIATFEDTERLPDSAFDPASHRYQATWDEFARGYGTHNAQPYALRSDASGQDQGGRVIVAAVTTRAQVLTALRAIAGQGEVPEKADRPSPLFTPSEGKSHYERFEKLFTGFESILAKEGYENWSPSRPVATNPGPEKFWNKPTRTTIPWGTALHWAELFNLRYRMLLSLMTYLFSVPRDGSPSSGVARGQILGRLFGEMYNMKAIAGVLVRLPLEDGQKGGEMAGPPFDMPYTLGQPLSDAKFWRTQLELLDKSADLAKFLLTDDYRGRAPAEGERYLHLMREGDLEARRWVEKVVAAEESRP